MKHRWSLSSPGALALLLYTTACAQDPAGPPPPGADGGADPTPDGGPPADPRGLPVESDLVSYLRSSGNLRLHDVHLLRDGSFLLAGGADSLDALPAGPRAPLAVEGLRGAVGGSAVAFLLHLSADLGQVLRVIHLPPGSARNLRWIREGGGALFVSGTTTADKAQDSGAFLARLADDLQNPRFVYLRNLWVTGSHQEDQPWDVGTDGKVVYVAGQPFGADWAALYRLRPDGSDDVVPDWRYHFGRRRQDGAAAEGGFTPASSRPDLEVTRSAVVLKATGRCDLRSWTSAQYSARTSDGNGATRQGSWPLDLFFSGPCDPAAPTSGGPGYTGYRLGANPTLRVGAIAIDRRDNHLYVGLSIQSRLPDGNPDFEPAVLAMSDSGALKWWSRLYPETPQNSTPDQYVDALAVDPAGDSLVVGARCHGNNVVNLWRGDQVAARPGQRGFQNQFTGNNGNIHISWLGKLALRDGALRAATYVAEYTDAMTGTGRALADPRYEGWPDPNQGWADLNTTRLRPRVTVDGEGRVYLLATGRRTLTTSDAYQKMIKKDQGSSSWNDFVRVYEPDLSALRYSSLLTGAWDPQSGAGGDNVTTAAVLPLRGGLLVVGASKLDAAGAPAGNPLPTTSPLPPWGVVQGAAQAGVLARLRVP